MLSASINVSCTTDDTAYTVYDVYENESDCNMFSYVGIKKKKSEFPLTCYQCKITIC